mgnify:CR=1 FL=1
MNQRGITMVSIILFGLLVLSVVLVNYISINTKRISWLESHKAERIATSYCGHPFPLLPEECPITAVFRCGKQAIMRNNCLGTGEALINERGKFVALCGQTTFGSVTTSCGTYWQDSQGTDCRATNNLCTSK